MMKLKEMMVSARNPVSSESENEVELESGGASESDDDGEVVTGVIDKEFMGCCPSDEDLEGISALCKQLMKHLGIDVGEFAQILVEQNYVTTVMKGAVEEAPMELDEEEDNAVYGVFGMINLKAKKDKACIKLLVKFILDTAKKSLKNGQEDIFKKVLGEGSSNEYRTGFLIKEKILNIPGVASPPFLCQLRNDMRESTLKGMPYDFTHYVHMAKVVKLTSGVDYFIDQDDEFIQSNCLAQVDYFYEDSVDSELVFQSNLGAPVRGKGFRRIFIFSEENMKNYLKDMSEIDAVRAIMTEAHGTGLKI